jgi:hypothetical protein
LSYIIDTNQVSNIKEKNSKTRKKKYYWLNSVKPHLPQVFLFLCSDI